MPIEFNREQAQFIDSYAAQLGLRWHYVIRADFVDRPQITVDPVKQRHYISMPIGYYSEGMKNRVYYAHELTHAYFAERMDPVFAHIPFLPILENEDPDFNKHQTETYYSQSLIDVWVTDRIYTVDKQLAREENVLWIDRNLKALDAQFPSDGTELIVTSALTGASIRRQNFKDLGRKFERVQKRIKNLYGNDALRKAREIEEVYAGMPMLEDINFEINKAIEIYSEYTAKTAKILGYEIEPILVEIGGKYFWDYRKK